MCQHDENEGKIHGIATYIPTLPFLPTLSILKYYNKLKILNSFEQRTFYSTGLHFDNLNNLALNYNLKCSPYKKRVNFWNPD